MASRPIAVGDCETDPFKLGRVPKPFIWGYYNGEDYHEFETAQEFIEFVEDKKEIIYFHNGGKFDYFYMLDELEPFSDVTIINGRLSKFKIGECEFRDSINILPVPLSALQKQEFDYTKLEPEIRHKHMREIKEYLYSDCVNLYKFVKAFIDQYGTNLTVASTALKQWKKIRNIHIPETNEVYYNFIKPYYYGGRVECFVKGVLKGDFQSYDINSAYPFAMMTEHPYGSFYIEKKGKPETITGQNFYTIRASSSGALPLRSENGLNFPHIEDEIFHVTGWELKTGLETETVFVHEYIKEIHYPERMDFKEYVNHFYDLKNKADKKSPEYTFAKLFLNSLYGKFAANPEKYSEYMILNKKYIKAGIQDGYEFAGELGNWGLMRQPLPDEKKKYYNIATAASITGFVRAFLFRHIWELKQAGFKPLYCDTDCIFFEGKETPPFSIGDKLGQWEKEYSYIRGAIAGKKLYAFQRENLEYKKASKGCNLSGKEIFSVASGEEIIYKDIVPVYSVFKNPDFQERKIKST